YNLLSSLDRGGMGELFLASKQGLAKPCVVKVLLPKFSRNAQYRRRFLREAKILAGLRHGRIVPVIDFGEDQGFLYIVMEFIDCVNLQVFVEALARGGKPMPHSLVAYIAGEVLEALRHAHERTVGGRPWGVIHRDIKPSNVLITSEGEVLLTDFGIARYEAEMSAEMFGTISYMAPEQALGTTGYQSDLFGAAALVHYMLTGRPPRTACNIAELHAVLRDPPPHTGRDDVPEPLERFRLLGLEPDVGNRLGSARGGLEILEGWAGYRKRTTLTAEHYDRYVGPRRSGMTKLNPAANNEEHAPQQGAPVEQTVVTNPSASTVAVSKPPPPSGESPAARDGHVWKPWWHDEKPDTVSEEATTTRWVEPDAPRVFRRRRSPLIPNRSESARSAAGQAPEPTVAVSGGDDPPVRTPTTERLSDNGIAGGPAPVADRRPTSAATEMLMDLDHPRREVSSAKERAREKRASSGRVLVASPVSVQTASDAGRHDAQARSRRARGRFAALLWLSTSIVVAVLGIALSTSRSTAGSADGVSPSPQDAVEVGARPLEQPRLMPTAAAVEQDPVLVAGPVAEPQPATALQLEEDARSTVVLTPADSDTTGPSVDEQPLQPSRSSDSASPSKRVRVELLFENAKRGEIRIGEGTVRSFAERARIKLRPGRYPLSWRASQAEPWQRADDLRVLVDDPASEYLVVRVWKDGTVLERVARESGADAR
ncbi:MAG: protein kinase, partial [Nannocystaceae bacterium]